MGGRIITLVTEADGLEISAAVEMPLHKAVGQDAGIVAGCGPQAVWAGPSGWK